MESSACRQPLSGGAVGVHHHLDIQRIHRVAHAVHHVRARQRRRVAVHVDDRKLGPRHRVLRHHEGRTGLVLTNRRRSQVRLPPFGGTRPDLTGRLGLLRGDGSKRQSQTGQRKQQHANQFIAGASRKDDKCRSEPVSRILSACATPSHPCCHERHDGLRRDDHSSSPAITGGIKRPTRKLRTGRPQALPYLVLLRAGFCLPPTLRPARCALTAPFHPYPPSLALTPCGVCSSTGRPLQARRSASARGRYIFCATVLQVALTGRYPAHCPAEFGLSSLRLSPCGLRRTTAV